MALDDRTTGLDSAVSRTSGTSNLGPPPGLARPMELQGGLVTAAYTQAVPVTLSPKPPLKASNRLPCCFVSVGQGAVTE